MLDKDIIFNFVAGVC